MYLPTKIKLKPPVANHLTIPKPDPNTPNSNLVPAPLRSSCILVVTPKQISKQDQDEVVLQIFCNNFWRLRQDWLTGDLMSVLLPHHHPRPLTIRRTTADQIGFPTTVTSKMSVNSSATAEVNCVLAVNLSEPRVKCFAKPFQLQGRRLGEDAGPRSQCPNLTNWSFWELSYNHNSRSTRLTPTTYSTVYPSDQSTTSPPEIYSTWCQVSQHKCGGLSSSILAVSAYSAKPFDDSSSKLQATTRPCLNPKPQLPTIAVTDFKLVETTNQTASSLFRNLISHSVRT